MYDIWGKSQVFYNHDEVLEFAFKKEKKIRTEYGVSTIHATKYSFN